MLTLGIAFCMTGFGWIRLFLPGTPRNMEPNKCEMVKWIDVEKDLPTDTLPHVRSALRSFKLGVPFAIDPDPPR